MDLLQDILDIIIERKQALIIVAVILILKYTIWRHFKKGKGGSVPNQPDNQTSEKSANSQSFNKVGKPGQEKAEEEEFTSANSQTADGRNNSEGNNWNWCEPDFKGEAPYANGSNTLVNGNLNVACSKVRLKHAVGGIFCYLLQQEGVLNKKYVLGCRKFVAKNFTSVDSASSCISYMQTLILKGVKDINFYFDIANRSLDVNKKQKLVKSLQDWFCGRPLNENEVALISFIKQGLNLDSSTIDTQETNA